VNNENVGETDHFSIDPETGEVRAKVRFDREEREKYELVLVARDHGTPVSFETLRYLKNNTHYQVLLGIINYYKVLPSITRYHRVIISYRQVPLDIIRNHYVSKVVLGIIKYKQVPLGIF
jgi:hypothetical protein